MGLALIISPAMGRCMPLTCFWSDVVSVSPSGDLPRPWHVALNAASHEWQSALNAVAVRRALGALHATCPLMHGPDPSGQATWIRGGPFRVAKIVGQSSQRRSFNLFIEKNMTQAHHQNSKQRQETVPVFSQIHLKSIDAFHFGFPALLGAGTTGASRLQQPHCHSSDGLPSARVFCSLDRKPHFSTTYDLITSRVISGVKPFFGTSAMAQLKRAIYSRTASVLSNITSSHTNQQITAEDLSKNRK
uniref:Uncharacterized protein n=1 Tax=Oryza brachyantha TaxID=4533 RepID=J3LXN7_ORYBR